MVYCDTSVLVAALTPETATETVQAWLGAQGAGTLAISGWTVTEFSGALSIKLRSGELSVAQRASVMTHWRLMLAENLVTLPVPGPAYDLAARFADRHDLKIRAGDALHLAVASLAGLPLATLDRTMAEAAAATGVAVSDVGL